MYSIYRAEKHLAAHLDININYVYASPHNVLLIDYWGYFNDSPPTLIVCYAPLIWKGYRVIPTWGNYDE